MALFGTWVAALGLQEWRRRRSAHRQATNSLYPGSTREMMQALDSLHPYGDAESRALYRRLEAQLRRKDPRALRRAQRHKSPRPPFGKGG